MRFWCCSICRNCSYNTSRTWNISRSLIHIHISSQFLITISSVRMEPAEIQSQSKESVLELSPRVMNFSTILARGLDEAEYLALFIWRPLEVPCEYDLRKEGVAGPYGPGWADRHTDRLAVAACLSAPSRCA